MNSHGARLLVEVIRGGDLQPYEQRWAVSGRNEQNNKAAERAATGKPARRVRTAEQQTSEQTSKQTNKHDRTTIGPPRRRGVDGRGPSVYPLHSAMRLLQR